LLLKIEAAARQKQKTEKQRGRIKYEKAHKLEKIVHDEQQKQAASNKKEEE